MHCGSYKGEWADAAATAFPNFQKHCLFPFKQMIMQQMLQTLQSLGVK